MGRTLLLLVPASCSALFLVWSSLLFVLVVMLLTSIGSSMFVLYGVDDCSEKGRLTTFCMVSEAHAFFSGMGSC